MSHIYTLTLKRLNNEDLELRKITKIKLFHPLLEQRILYSEM